VSLTERAPLNREKVAHAAVELLDEEGPLALSMRKLGARLGVEAMSLYNHVKNKDDLLTAAADVLYAEILHGFVPDPDRPFETDTEDLARRVRCTVLAHPGASTLVLDRPVQGIVGVVFLGRCFEVFGKVAHNADEAVLAFSSSASMITGALRHEALVTAAMASGSPSVEEVAGEPESVAELKTATRACSAEERFDAAIGVLVSGLLHRFGADQA